MFVRYAPATFGAIDKIREARQERELARERAREAAQNDQGPRFSGNR